ncbi:MAG: MBL fold metallo-hydrolase [bacterium]
MSIGVERDVLQLRASSWRGRAVGYDVSMFVLRGVLIDSAFPRVNREVMGAVGEIAPRGAIITHWHEDHAGNAAQLASEGVPLRMHAGCEATLRARPPIRAYRRIVWGRSSRLAAPLTRFDPAPLQVIDTPGHSKDHVVVWDAERGIVASGDLFLGVKVRVAHAHERPSILVKSLRAVAALEPRLLLDAHRGPLLNATALLRAKIDWMEETIGSISTLHACGASEHEIARRVLGREDLTGVVSLGEYSRASLVHAVLHEHER